MSQVPVYSIFKVHEAAPDCGWERTPSLTLNKEAIFEGVFQKKLKKFFVPLGKQKSRPSENGKAALRLNDLLVHIYIVYCGQAYGRRATLPVEALLLPLRMPLFCSFEIIALVGCGIGSLSLFFSFGGIKQIQKIKSTLRPLFSKCGYKPLPIGL